MFELQRQHPAAALANAFDIIRANFITIIILIFVGSGGSEANFTLSWIIGTFLFLLIWGVISWYRFEFSVEEGELRIERGVLVRKKIYLTSDRIQVIDITAGVIQRLFGLVAVEVKTAGSSSKQAKISALTREKAEKLKQLLRKEVNGATKQGEQDESVQQSRIYALGTKDLLVAASTSGRFGVALSVVGVLFSQVEQLISEEQMIRFAEAVMPRTTDASIIAMWIVAIIVVSWIFSFVSTIVKYYDFVVEVREDELLINRGLFERTQLTIPFNRIQAVQIKEELLRQPLGYASLVIESAGYGESEGNSTTLFPLLRKQQIYRFIEEVIPDYNTQITENSKVPAIALRRYLLRMVWVSLPVILLVWGTVPYGVYSWFLLIPALLLGYQQYKDAEIARGEDTLKLSYRLLSKTTAIVKKYRMQACQIQQNPFQKRLNVGHFSIHVASGNQGRNFTVRDIEIDKAMDYRMWLSNGHPVDQGSSVDENEVSSL
ncbi:PH domain-containing protein [Fodinibius sp. Rm-B-1B1-1]|uniref:PH domain-containing protein n=1 Tax=Fodinibius alkaliphilus TaxID=3140241 RepID=UPI00315B2B98